MYAEKGYFLAEAKDEIVPQKNNEVSVKFKSPSTTRSACGASRSSATSSISSDELRVADVHRQPRASSSFGSGGPFRQDAFERDIAVHQRALLRPRLPLGRDQHAARDAHAGPQRHRGVASRSTRARATRSGSFACTRRGPDGREVEPLDGRRHLRNMVRAEAGRLLQSRRAARGPAARSARCTTTHGYANVDANPRDEARSRRRSEVDVIVPIERGPLVLLRAHRDPRQHQDARQGHPPRDGDRRGRASTARSLLERSRAAHHGARLLRARRRLDRARARRPDKINVLRRGHASARPARSRSARASRASRTSSRPRRCSRRTCSATARASRCNAQVSEPAPARQRRASSSPTSSTAGSTSSIELFDQLRVYTDFSQSSLGGGAHLRLSADRARAAGLASRTRPSSTRSRPRRPRTLLRHGERRQRVPAACRSRTSSTTASRRAFAPRSPTTRATTACSRRRASTCAARRSLPPPRSARRTSS